MTERKLKVYLSGATRNVDKEFQNWRNKCFFYPNIKFVDPISYFNYTDKQPKTDKQCIDLFMWQVERCDVLLCNLDNSDKSPGSCMEVEHAFCKDIPIISFGNKPETWYNWAAIRSTIIFNTLDEAVDYISNSYSDII